MGGRLSAAELIEQDVARRQAYVCEENEHIYAAFVLALGDEPTYRVIEGAWKNDRPYGTLHRVASTGRKARHGGCDRSLGV